jgi:hypothetical protein
VEGSREEVRQFLVKREVPSNLVVDLSEVTFVDARGEEALLWLNQNGARFRSNSAYSLDVCERLRLTTCE